MKRKMWILPLIIALTLSSIPIVEAKPGVLQVEWQRQLPGISGHSVIQTSDGGYLVLGLNASVQIYDGGGKEYVNKTSILLKTDSSGNLEWTKTYPFEGISLELSKVVQTRDGGYALAGTAVFNTTIAEGKVNLPIGKIYLLKIDSDGNAQWSKSLPSYNNSYLDADSGDFRAFIQTNDGGFALVSGFNHLMYLNAIWFVKTDSDGNLEYAKEIDSPLGGPDSVSQVSDGYMIVGGIIGRGGSGGRAGIVKMDLQGNTVWNQLYGEAYNQENPGARCGAPTNDGGYVIGGSFSGSRNAWIVKTDSEGRMVWDQKFTYGGSYTAIDSISQTRGGGYFFVASAQESKTVSWETKFFTWVAKTDSFGKVESQIVFLGGSNPGSIFQANDGGFVFVGTWRLNDVGNQQIWLVKFTPKTIPPEQLPPSIMILSPENKAYPLGGNISLTYIVDDTIRSLDYSINDQPNAALTGNSTIIGLPEGNHTLKIYAHDGLGNIETAETEFTIGEETRSAGEPLPTSLIIEITLIVVIVAIVGFILGTKTNQRKNKQQPNLPPN
jgi:hypothetical protein